MLVKGTEFYDIVNESQLLKNDYPELKKMFLNDLDFLEYFEAFMAISKNSPDQLKSIVEKITKDVLDFDPETYIQNL